VRELRACRGLSQEGLGFHCKLHRNYVGAVERGEINPTLKTLLALADGLDVELSSLIRLYEERQEDPEPLLTRHLRHQADQRLVGLAHDLV
jgi:transcriptional regulator with XRE-family HTH domain